MSSLLVELSLLSRVDGSCSISSEGVDIICSIAGPIEARARQELAQQAALEILICPPVGPSSTKEKLLENKLKNVLTRIINTYQYPRQLIQIVVQMLKNDDITIKNLKYIINSSYLALIDSGISLNSSFLSTCCILTTENKLKFEFTNLEFQKSVASFFSVFDLQNGLCDELIFFESNGDNLNQELISQVLSKSKQEIEALNHKIRKIIENKINKDYIWKI